MLLPVSAEKIRVTATVRNTGNVSGKEVVQVYASLPGGILEKEAHRLAAYAKTNELKPGEAQEVTMEVKMDGLTSYDEKRAAWILESGFYGIWVGNSHPQGLYEDLQPLRHTASHVMAQAVQNLYPEAKVAIGPSIDTGFYYDFDHEPFSREDLDAIEKEMKKIIKKGAKIERFSSSFVAYAVP